MKLNESNRTFAPDNQLNSRDNWLSTSYKKSRATKLFVHFVLFLVVAWFSNFAAADGKSTEFTYQLLTKPELKGASIILIWPSAAMLLHLYIYCRRCFYWSLLPGLLWPLFGDLVAAPYWMAVSGYLLTVFMRFKAFTTLRITLLIIASAGYLDIYRFIWHPNFFFLLGGWLILTVRVEKKRARRLQKKLQQRKPLSRLNMFGSNPDKVKQKKKIGETAPREPAAQIQPTLTAAQRPFAAFWLELHTLRQQPALSPLLQSELDGVTGYTERILECMQDDPNDVKPGSAFLERYLPQVTIVVKRGLSLSGKLSTHGKTDEIEQQCLNALKALNSAFAQQHLRLLENDTLEFETDLTVLNSLLKTDGFKQ